LRQKAANLLIGQFFIGHVEPTLFASMQLNDQDDSLIHFRPQASRQVRDLTLDQGQHFGNIKPEL
jgi:hypothetical protein